MTTTVKVRYRKSRGAQLTMALFNSETLNVLTLTEDKKEIEIEAIVTRLNTFTGNGRLVLKGANETTAFGFGRKYINIGLSTKKNFSENLDKNHGVESEFYQYLKLKVIGLRRADSKIAKYLVKGVL